MIKVQARRIREAIFAKLGRCPRCWRLSFRGAVIGWIGAGVIHLFFQDARLWYFILMWPISFSILWLLHIATFASRVVTVEQRRRSLSSLDRTASEGQPHAPRLSGLLAERTIGRRQMFLRFYRSAGWALLVSMAIPLTSACTGGNSVPSSNVGGGSTSACPCAPNVYHCLVAAGAPSGCSPGCYTVVPGNINCLEFLVCTLC